MPQGKKNRSTIWRVAGATCIAGVLWSVTSLSDTFVWTLKVPLTVELPRDQALVAPLPRTIEVTVRATGWALMTLTVGNTLTCDIYPKNTRGGEEHVEYISSHQLLENIGTTAETKLLRVSPDSLIVRYGPVSSKKVPLVPAVELIPRKGFQVVGQVRLEPDSVTLVGSVRALDSITSWPTAPQEFDDLHGPLSGQVGISDSLHGVVAATTRSTRLIADVQEVAERSFPDVPVVNRGTVRDTSIRLVLQPQRVEVLVRGGARDLSQLDPLSLVAYINVIEGTDTLGIARPRLMPLSGFTIVSIKPNRIRYLWKREVKE
jgi:hypothetical protein